MNKPRPFSLRPIYIDERSERLAAVEKRARQQIAAADATAVSAPGKLRCQCSPEEPVDRQRLHAAFASARHRQRKGGGLLLSLPMLLSLVLLLTASLLLLAFT